MTHRMAPTIRLRVILAILGGFQAISAAPSHVHDPIGSVRALIGRLLGPTYMPAFQLEVIPADPATGNDVFELDSESESVAGSPSVILRGNTGVAIAAGLHWYLKYECNASIAWGKGSSGNQLATVPAPAQLPKPARQRNVSPVRLRYAYNVSGTLRGLYLCTAKARALRVTRCCFRHLSVTVSGTRPIFRVLAVAGLHVRLHHAVLDLRSQR